MTKEIRLIDIKEEILSENKGLADKIREQLGHRKVLFLNIMGSPGSGKTSLVRRTIEALGSRYRIAVIEADIDSLIDAESIAAMQIPTVQLHTGGFCHVDANMVEKAIESLSLDDLDLLILENVGNLVCPAESDTGAHRNIAILSVPEGDDKAMKYPLMFTVSDVLVINKTDYLAMENYDIARPGERAKVLNESIRIFPLSCRNKEGLDDWLNWLQNELTLTC
jgi:hydrogenase nickel incorporation protein HypB